jgi:hypothetical protein
MTPPTRPKMERWADMESTPEVSKSVRSSPDPRSMPSSPDRHVLVEVESGDNFEQPDYS